MQKQAFFWFEQYGEIGRRKQTWACARLGFTVTTSAFTCATRVLIAPVATVSQYKVVVGTIIQASQYIVHWVECYSFDSP